jgi:hypothetical protein
MTPLRLPRLFACLGRAVAYRFRVLHRGYPAVTMGPASIFESINRRKEHTAGIERDNSNTRHHLGRFTRQTKVVSKKAEMINASLKLWRELTDLAILGQFQKMALSILLVNTLQN